MCSHRSVTPISSLRESGGPSAILGRIRAIVVDPVECHTARTTTHVFEKDIERRYPLGTHINPATAVINVSVARWISASLPCLPPRLILALSVLWILTLEIALVAAAASTLAVSKVMGSHVTQMAAVALAQPFGSTGIGNHFPSAKSLAEQIFKVGRMFGSFVFSHERVPPFVVRAVRDADYIAAARLVYT